MPTTLLIDADDTLWENITVFNGVNRAYVDWLLPGRTVAEMQSQLDELQVEFISTHGYGRDTFELSLVAGIERFTGRTPTADDRAYVHELVAPLRGDHLDLLDGVADTLATLTERVDLILVTKGDLAEQRHKVECSGLAHLFNAIEILETKAPTEYEQIIDRHGLDAEVTWMVGNSPRSDIVPALEVDLGAVFIPHAETWSHENATVDDHPRLIQLSRFAELLDHF